VARQENLTVAWTVAVIEERLLIANSLTLEELPGGPIVDLVRPPKGRQEDAAEV
jgi:hypothetical protein